jgi:hypothetical protein
VTDVSEELTASISSVILLRNVGEYLPDYTVLHPRREPPSFYKLVQNSPSFFCLHGSKTRSRAMILPHRSVLNSTKLGVNKNCVRARACVRFEALMAGRMLMVTMSFQVTVPCRLHFRSEGVNRMFVPHAVICRRVYTAPKPTILSSSKKMAASWGTAPCSLVEANRL